ncbi:hypothetical protein KC734_14870 [candidate division KSB1 bacterium]|nr:hypothetical protein [candidate division KSB1 bacterium]
MAFIDFEQQGFDIAVAFDRDPHSQESKHRYRNNEDGLPKNHPKCHCFSKCKFVHTPARIVQPKKKNPEVPGKNVREAGSGVSKFILTKGCSKARYCESVCLHVGALRAMPLLHIVS